MGIMILFIFSLAVVAAQFNTGDKKLYKSPDYGGNWAWYYSKFDNSTRGIIKTIKVCSSNDGRGTYWTKYVEMTDGYGTTIKSSSTPGSSCKTFTLEQGDCISTIWTYYGGYVEYMQAKTQRGKYITL